jgi:CRISPR-associated protein (TIGR02710 family)
MDNQRPRPVLLVCTVGGAPQPPIQSILHEPRPDKVLFICSPDTRSSVTNEILPGVAAQGFSLGPAQHDVIEIDDPQDLGLCVRQILQELTSPVHGWRDQHHGDVIVDPTGGTKVMSIALALAARRWPCTFRYIGGTQREQRPGGPGAVLTGSEKVIQTYNPLDLLGYQLAEDALTLANAGNYAAAHEQLDRGARSASQPAVKRSLQTLAQLLGVFARWDQFRHADARSRLCELEKNRNDLAYFLHDRSVRIVENELQSWNNRLETLAGGRPSRELIEDLLANARRRRREGRYDDAVARLYRAVEAMAQWRLAQQHGIPDTAAVPAEKVPETLRAELTPSGQGAFQLGLQDAYRLLQALGDPLGQRFRQLQLDDRARSPLAERNRSILAHGWQPVSENACQSLWEKTRDLAAELDIREEGLFDFPELRTRWR